MISKVVQTELAELLSRYQDMTDAGGGPLVVRNGYLPQRELMTGMGPVDIKVPKTRDRGGQGIHFRSELLPPYIKRTKSVETVLPWLYLSRWLRIGGTRFPAPVHSVFFRNCT